MATPTVPLDNLMHCAGCGNTMSPAPSDGPYRCTRCGTRINALNAHRTLIKHIMANVVSAELAAEMQGPIQDLLEEQVRQHMPGVEPPDMSAECILRYGTDPETYLRGDAEDATKLLGIIVERIDAGDRKAVITYRFTSLDRARGIAVRLSLCNQPHERDSIFREATCDAHRTPHRQKRGCWR